jgi:Uma2 family endonuclease
MEVALQRHLFTVEDFCALFEAGILGEDDRVELIEGEILTMPPIGPPHPSGVDRLTMQLAPRLLGRAIVRVQGSIRIGERSLPQPDVAVLRFRDDYYAGRMADAREGDVLLVVEVAASSLKYDRGIKLPLYARGGVPEVWIVAVDERVLEVYRRPAEGAYREATRLQAGDTAAPEAFPDVDVAVADLLP